MINYSKLCKFIGKSKERILSKLNKSEVLRLYSVVHVAMETTKTSNFTCQLKSFISIFSLPKFQLVSCKLSKLRSATLSLSTTAIFFCLQGGRCGGVQLISTPKSYQFNNNKLYNWHCKS